MFQQNRQLWSVVAFPAILMVGIVLIPVVPDYTNHALAEVAVRQTTRWLLGHFLAALAFGFGTLAVQAVEGYLHSSVRTLPSVTFPLIAIGATLYAFGLGADGIGPLAVQAAGASPILFFDGSGWWVTGIFIAGTVVFGGGLLSMVLAAIQQEFLTGWSRYCSFGSVLLWLTAPMILSGWALYGVAVAAFGTFLPLVWAAYQEQQRGPLVNP